MDVGVNTKDMPKFEDQLELVYAGDRTEWRRWLETNHRTSTGIWLVYYKVKQRQRDGIVGKGNEAIREQM